MLCVVRTTARSRLARSIRSHRWRLHSVRSVPRSPASAHGTASVQLRGEAAAGRSPDKINAAPLNLESGAAGAKQSKVLQAQSKAKEEQGGRPLPGPRSTC
jgi:hypothetical protein